MLLHYIIPATLSLIGARLLSMIVWFCISKQVQRVHRAGGIAVVTALVVLSWRYDPGLLESLVPTAVALFYFAALVPFVHATAEAWSPVGLVGFTAGLCGLLTLSVVIPLHVIAGPSKLPFVVKGLEFALAAYSYLAESKRLNARDLRECFFFLLVNPVLVFHEFGRRSGPSALPSRNLARCCLGAAAVACYFAMDGILDRLWISRETLEVSRIRTLADYGRFIVAVGMVALSTYLVHSGTASLQIGAMRLAGYIVPERYRYAFLAVTPADWWRRWNTYVSSWFASYCLLPCGVFLRRQCFVSRTTAVAFSVVACFLVSGLVHAVGSSAIGRASIIVACFIAEAATVLIWAAVAGAWLKTTRRLPARITNVTRPIAAIGSWIVLTHVQLLILSVLLPALADG